ncbi:hypothetical protein BAXH7_00247 [Bacillus amyloliquefaciens XH7]|nr:hypothetical protein BAXH7_00247 [Bacillus amyloliquefaciens XH7]
MIKKRSDKIVCLFQEKTSAKKRKNRAKVCRFKTAAWVSLLQVGKTKCEGTSSPHSRMPDMKKIAAYLVKQG